jgi:hypothetical protein
MTKLSEKYRAIANLYAYLEARPFDDLCSTKNCSIIDNSDGIEIRESLYQKMIASPGARQLLERQSSKRG